MFAFECVRFYLPRNRQNLCRLCNWTIFYLFRDVETKYHLRYNFCVRILEKKENHTLGQQHQNYYYYFFFFKKREKITHTHTLHAHKNQGSRKKGTEIAKPLRSANEVNRNAR